MNSQYLNLNNPKEFHVLCSAIGLDKAYLLARINGWVVFNESKENKEAFAGGCYWMFATQEQFSKEIFPFMPIRSLKRYLADLTKEGLLISERHNRIKSSRLWYRVNQDAVNALCNAEKAKMTNSVISECQNGTFTTDSKCQNGTIPEYPKCQNGTITNLNECQNGTKEAYTKCQNGTYEQQNSGLSAKMAPSECQNGTTIERIKENINNLYFPLFGSFSPFTISSEDGQERELGIDDIDELQRRRKLFNEFLKDFLPNNLGRGKLEDAVCKQLLYDLNELRKLIDGLTNDNPGSSTAVSAADLFKKYGSPFAC